MKFACTLALVYCLDALWPMNAIFSVIFPVVDKGGPPVYILIILEGLVWWYHPALEETIVKVFTGGSLCAITNDGITRFLCPYHHVTFDVNPSMTFVVVLSANHVLVRLRWWIFNFAEIQSSSGIFLTTQEVTDIRHWWWGLEWQWRWCISKGCQVVALEWNGSLPLR